MQSESTLSVPKLTRAQAAIVSAYTGFLVGPFSDMHGYIERVMGRSVFTHEMADKAVMAKIREAAKSDFIALVPEADHHAE